MKQFLLSIILFAFAFTIKAQNIDNTSVMQLVAGNSEAIGIQKDKVNTLKVSSTYNSAGTQYVYLLQTYKGVPVYNQMLVLAFKDNKLISHAGKIFAAVENEGLSASPSLSVENAVGAAFLNAKLPAPAIINKARSTDKGMLDFGKLAGVSENVTAELMWVQNEKSQSLKLVWQVQVVPTGKPDMWLTQIDAINGSVVDNINLTVYEQDNRILNPGILALRDAQLNTTDVEKTAGNFMSPPPPPTVTAGNYNVVPFPYESPAHHVLTLVNNPWLNAGIGNNATTNGWHFDGTTNYDITRGNNVHAYLDVDNNNTPNQAGNNFSAQSTTANPSLTFNFVPIFTQDPNITVNKNTAVTNLFYWNNLMHDVMYQYGFDEAGGNFQTDNIGRGGLGNDYVQAEAQDGGGANNANFGTPADGGRPRMQMYLFDAVASVTLKVNTPAAIAGNYTAVESGFSTANKLAAVGPKTGQVVYFNDATGGTHEACTGAPSNSLTGKIALINRGTCGFIVKVKEAQNAGAIAVIMVNNAPGAPIVMGGTDNTITIPAVMVSDVDGATFAAQLANNVNVTLSATSGQRLDGDLDNGVVTHEYGHGISNRLTGGPANVSCLGNAEQGGEGWSDYVALMMTTNWATATVNDGPIARPMGTYVEGQNIVTGAGIRNYPYSTNIAVNPLTYANVGTGTIGTEVHNIGEVWCMSIWEMTWSLIQSTNTINPNLFNNNNVGGNSIALKLVLEGMKLQPCSPGFLDARNAILQADQNLYGGVHTCAIWTAFAKRGMGFSAVQGLSTNATDQVAAFDLPPAVNFTTQPASTSVCLPTPATFSVTVTGTPSTLQWQVSTDNGVTWTNISGATTTSYTTPATVLTDNGKKYRVIGTNACGSTISNVATLSVISASVGGTVSPANTSACGVPSITGTLTLSGQSGNIIRWESSIDGGITWVPIANTNTTYTYTVSVTTQFRVFIQGGGCASPAFSSVATVTMVAGQPLIITADPGTTVCAGDPTKLTVQEGPLGPTTATMTQTLTTSNTVVTFNFRNNNAFPVTITDISSIANFIGGTANVSAYYKPSAINGAPGAITVANGWNQFGSASVPSVGGVLQPFMSGLTLTVPAGATYGILVSSSHAAGTNNIIYSNALAQSIASAGGCDIITGANIGYAGGPVPAAPATANRYFIGSVKFNGPTTPVTTGVYTWSPAAGLNNTTGNPVAASPATTTTYSVSNDNGAGCVRNASILITVNQRPAITVQPVNVTSCAASTATFSVTATGTNLTYQWQVSTDNCTTYTNIAGATAATLTLANVTAVMNNNGYRCIISGTCTPAVTTTCAKLTVNALPPLAITPSGVICGGVPGVYGVAITTGGQASPPPIPGSKTFTSTTSVLVPDGNVLGATSVIPVTGIPANATVTNVTVTLNMSHTYPGDMTFNIKGANGVVANLYKHNSDLATGAASGPATWGWYGAQVSGSGTASFKTVATAPFIYGATPVFTPDLLNGLGTSYPISDPTGYASTATAFSQLYLPGVTTTINGNWTLAMADGGGGDVGTLAGWSLKIDYTTPDPATPPITYTWSPAAGLYTDANATIPYVAGSPTPTVYAAPTAITTYTVTAAASATGCLSSATIVVNYTPPAPTLTPNPATVCAGGIVKLKSNSLPVIASPAIWTPFTGLYTDAAATTAYTGNAVDSVYAKPGATTVYTATVNSASGTIPTVATMTQTPAFVVTNITYNFRNNNLYPVTLTNISSMCNTAGATNVSAFYKASAINGAPGAITVANGWTQIGTTTAITAIGGVVQPFLSGLNLTVPAGATYGILLQAVTPANGVNLVMSGTLTQSIASAGGCDIITGANIGYTANTAVVPAAPTLTPYFFIGSVGFVSAIAPCTSPAASITVNVNTPVTITGQPGDATTCTDKSASFTVAATGSAIGHNWRVSTNGGVLWTDVANGGVYSGAKTATLVITAPPVSMNGYLYKDSVSTTPCVGKVSNSARLIVNPLPVVTLKALPYTKILPPLTTTLTATSTTLVSANGYKWFRNGVQVVGATTNTYVVDVDHLGEYTATVKDANSCGSAGLSNAVLISDSASGRVFIYPTPNSGQFQVRFYSVINNTNLPRGVNVFDARGKRVLTQTYSINAPYARMDVDLRKYGTGVYWVEVVDGAGNRLAMGRTEVLR